MSEFFALHSSVHPVLSTIATSLVQADRECVCPKGIGQLLCASSGSCFVTIDDKQVELLGARMIFLIGEVSYQLSHSTADFSLTRLDIELKPGKLCGFGLGELETAFPEMRRFTRHSLHCAVFYDNFAMVMTSLQLLRTFSLYEPGQRERQISLTLSFLLSAAATSSWEEDLADTRYGKHVRTALQYIHENYMSSISTTDIAQAAGVHIGHLHRIFLAETGYRVGEYLTKIRMDKAKSLLMRTDISTIAVAHRVGVSTQQYFSRLFKQQVGMTPQAFRKSYALTCPASAVLQYNTYEAGDVEGRSV
ncbi:MAG: helix-turn-helix transcriptional regulator [Eubacteriales bacterium]|nr:helix-turn-helix transcriptional regulator [Eubacteriales bacterium]